VAYTKPSLPRICFSAKKHLIQITWGKFFPLLGFGPSPSGKYHTGVLCEEASVSVPCLVKAPTLAENGPGMYIQDFYLIPIGAFWSPTFLSARRQEG
jgi:hypothetical protein